MKPLLHKMELTPTASEVRCILEETYKTRDYYALGEMDVIDCMITIIGNTQWHKAKRRFFYKCLEQALDKYQLPKNRRCKEVS